MCLASNDSESVEQTNNKSVQYTIMLNRILVIIEICWQKEWPTKIHYNCYNFIFFQLLDSFVISNVQHYTFEIIH